MPATSFLVRLARDDDRLPLAELFAAVAEERDGIATEPPVDLDARAASWELDWIFVATAEHEVIGLVHLSPSRHGYCDIALAVARGPDLKRGNADQKRRSGHRWILAGSGRRVAPSATGRRGWQPRRAGVHGL